MIVLYLGVVFIFCSFLMFSYTYKIAGINRTLTTLPRAVIEVSIPLTIQDEEILLYYDQNLLIKSYESYLKMEVKKYVDNYHVEYYFYNTNDGGFCDIKDCRGVEIYFSAEVMLGITYKRTFKYEIKESDLYGKRSIN